MMLNKPSSSPFSTIFFTLFITTLHSHAFTSYDKNGFLRLTTLKTSNVVQNADADIHDCEEDTKQNNIFSGKRKWLGGAVDSQHDGSIFGVPSHSHSILQICPPCAQGQCALCRTIPLPIPLQKRRFKWLRGLILNRNLYAIPAWGPGVLKMNLEDQHIDLLPLPPDIDASTQRNARWMWHGAAASTASNSIYCIPSNANRILKVNVEMNECSYIGPDLGHEKNKWYGGIRGVDDAIYGIPYTSSHLLRIDAITEDVSLIGYFSFKQYNWHGGILCPTNGAIYAFPSHASTVLKIDTTIFPPILSELPIQQHENDTMSLTTRYKWLGGAIGNDGKIYAMPSDATSVLKIDPVTDEVTTFGHVSGEKNKWQGGVLAKDGWIYAIPCNADHILRIDTGDGADAVELIDGGFVRGQKDKYQGGFLGRDDCIYGIPENAEHVMRIVPGEDCAIEIL